MTFINGKKLVHLFVLTEKDVGAVFTCFMTHPALPETRNYSITPLSASTTATATTTTTIPKLTTRGTIETHTNLPSHPSESNATTEEANVGKSITEGSQSFVFPVIIAVSLIAATVVIVVAIFLIKRRKNRNFIPLKLNYDLTVENDRSTTAEYASVSTPDSIDKVNKINNAKKDPQGHSSEQGSSGAANVKGPVEDNLKATNYTGLNLSEIKHCTYEELKLSSMNNPNPTPMTLL